MNIFLFLSIIFIATLAIGTILKKFHIPWIFAALIIGLILAIWNPFDNITSTATFNFLSELGMYLLLFMIGYELDTDEMKKKGKFILKASFLIIGFEAIFGSLIFYFLFDVNIGISIILGFSFATVGESILIPILDESNETNEPLGQTIIGVGTMDDIIEILCLIFVIISVGTGSHDNLQVSIIIISLFALFALTYLLIKIKKTGKKFEVMNIETLFFMVMFVLFLFLGIGIYAEAAALGALLAGIGLKRFIPKERRDLIESEVRTMCYGFFAPLFFLSVGLTMDIKTIGEAPLLVLLVVIVSSLAKLLGSYLVGKKELGKKNSILLGVGLSIRFSTSIVIISILFSNNLINESLYSVLIASSMIFTFVVPILFSYLLTKKNKQEEKS